MAEATDDLPPYPVDILVAAEGPMLAADLIALLMEPRQSDQEHTEAILEGLAAFKLGRSEKASAEAIQKAGRYKEIAKAVRDRGMDGLGARGIGPDVRSLLASIAAIQLTGDPMTDWRAVRTQLDASSRDELRALAKEARHMRLLRRGIQIESSLAEAWRTYGSYNNARALLAAAAVEDQFAATTRPHQGVTVMTIHKAKGKEFDEVIVFESSFSRYIQRRDSDSERSARFNLHVAATRARRAVTIMTPKTEPCHILP